MYFETYFQAFFDEDSFGIKMIAVSGTRLPISLAAMFIFVFFSLNTRALAPFAPMLRAPKKTVKGHLIADGFYLQL